MSYITHQVKSNRNSVIYDVVSYNPETKRGKLRGQYGVVFEINMSVENLKKLGYKVVRVADVVVTPK